MTRQSWLLRAVLILGVVLGLALTLQGSFAAWQYDSDMADLPLLGLGGLAHGWRFIGSWYYTPDNWLLSLAPLQWAACAVLGARPAVLLGSGWLIYLGCVAGVAGLAWRLSDISTALGIAAWLLLANAAALGQPGFLTYPISHTISLLWGLVALHLSLWWLWRRSRVALVATFLTLLIDGLSDPWSVAAILLAITAGALVAALLPRLRPWRPRLLALSATALAATVLSATRLLHLATFLPPLQLQAGSTTPAMNLHVLVVQLGAIFDPVPGLAAPGFVTSLAIVLALACLALCACLWLGRALWAGTEIGASFVVLAIAAACASIPLALLLARFGDPSAVGRFCMAIVTLLPLLLWLGLRRTRLRNTVLALAGLVIVAGLVNRPVQWWRQPIRPHIESAMMRVDVLRAAGLTYGYGGYWGAGGNAVTLATHQAIRLRPVQFDPASGRIVPRRAQTSPMWYGPRDAGSGGSTFVWITPDGENCPDPQRCIDGVTGQFGAPDRVLHARDTTILVWNRRIALSPADPAGP